MRVVKYATQAGLGINLALLIWAVCRGDVMAAFVAGLSFGALATSYWYRWLRN